MLGIHYNAALHTSEGQCRTILNIIDRCLGKARKRERQRMEVVVEKEMGGQLNLTDDILKFQHTKYIPSKINERAFLSEKDRTNVCTQGK